MKYSRMKNLLFSLFFLLSVAVLNATVTLQIRTQLANSSGVATNDMYWGVLVDSTDDGFAVTSTGEITAFDFTTNGAYGNDSFFVGSSTTAFFAPLGGAGVAANTSPITLGGNVSAGDSFGIFWTDKASGSGVDGDAYGFVSVSGAVLPSDGSTTPFNTVFTGDPYTAQGSIIPEPSIFALFSGIFALGAVMLRRRAI